MQGYKIHIGGKGMIPAFAFQIGCWTWEHPNSSHNANKEYGFLKYPFNHH